MVASQRKLDRAQQSKWRTQRIAWSRASGLRRQLVQTVAEQELRRERKAEAKAAEVAHRRMLWQLEDSAAMMLQDKFRKRRRLREEDAAQKALLAVRLSPQTKTVMSHEKGLQKGALVKGVSAKSPKPKLSTPKQENKVVGVAFATAPDEAEVVVAVAEAVEAEAGAEQAVHSSLSWPEDAEERERRFEALAWTAHMPLAEVSDALTAGLDETLASLNRKLLQVEM